MTSNPTEDQSNDTAKSSARASASGSRRSWRALPGGRRGLFTLAGLVVIVAATLAYFYSGETAAKPQYRLARIERGAIVSAVTASGTAQALVTVQVGSQLSGRIKELLVDFNDRVKKGQIIARLDIDHLTARLQQAEADHKAAVAMLAMQTAQQEKARHDVALATAQLQKVKAALVEAKREVARKSRLASRGFGARADAEKAVTALRQAEADIAAAEAQLAGAGASLKVATAQRAGARATVAQRQASVMLVKVDLQRSEIRSPIDGVVIERSVDVGQTVAASLQAPTLFTIAQDLRQLEIHASVDEADVGRIAVGQSASFTVAAFPNRTFDGKVKQIRLAPKEEANVVTYTVVISAGNPDSLLLPGMTANIRIVSERRKAALKVPNAALRYRPPGAGAGINPGAFSGRGNFSAARIAARLAKSLGLTEQQKRQVQSIFEELRTDMRKLRAQRMPRTQRRQRLRSVRRKLSERITAILTETQRAKYGSLRRLRANRSRGRIYTLGKDGRPRATIVRVGITDGAFSAIRGRGIKRGLSVIVGQSRGGKARRGRGGNRRSGRRRLGF